MIDDEIITRSFIAIRQMLETEKKNERSLAELTGILAAACESYIAHYRMQPGAEPWTVIDALRLAGCCVHIACALHAADQERQTPEEILQ